MSRNASQRAWGAVLVKHGLSQQIRDSWINLEGDINALEARALCNALSSFSLLSQMQETMCGQNMTLRAAWENGGCRSSLVEKDRRNVFSWKLCFAFEKCPIEQKYC